MGSHSSPPDFLKSRLSTVLQLYIALDYVTHSWICNFHSSFGFILFYITLPDWASFLTFSPHSLQASQYMWTLVSQDLCMCHWCDGWPGASHAASLHCSISTWKIGIMILSHFENYKWKLLDIMWMHFLTSIIIKTTTKLSKSSSFKEMGGWGISNLLGSEREGKHDATCKSGKRRWRSFMGVIALPPLSTLWRS